MMGIDPTAFEELKTKSARTIRSLERHMKRADYRLRQLVPPEDYVALIDCWKKHLRWIRLHLVYFKPVRPILKKSKTRYQLVLNDLIAAAKYMISAEGFLLPSEVELRRVMRMYARSARRGREAYYTVQHIIGHKFSEISRWHLVEFIEKRVPLQPVPKT